MRKYILGGAQFSDAYGIYVPSHNNNRIEIDRLLNYASEINIKSIDLANSYKGSFDRLSRYTNIQNFSISTKIHYSRFSEKAIYQALKNNLRKIGLKSYSIIFIHNWASLDFRSKRKSLLFLKSMIENSVAHQPGISIYETYELRDYNLNQGVIQAPLNFYNNQFINCNLAIELKKAGVIFQARSLFHQGVLLNTNNKLVSKYRDLIQFIQYCKLHNVSHLEACLQVYDTQKLFTELVIGVNNWQQLKQISNIPITQSNINTFASEFKFDKQFTDPRNWQ